jgi:hypothetical protein
VTLRKITSRQSTRIFVALGTTLRTIALGATALATTAGLVGCNSTSSGPAPITVDISSVGFSLPVNSQTPVVANVNNDKAMGGVTWSCTPASTCGTFSPTTTVSGASSIYTAPAFVSASGAVAIIATSVTNSTISSSDSGISITAATLADGNYVFSLSGFDYFHNVPYRVAGVFTVSAGIITAGEQDFVDFHEELSDDITAGATACTATTSPIVSCLTTTSDGNLQIILVTGDANLGVTVGGVNGVETLDGTVYPLNTGKAAITEYDASASGSGLLETQNGGFTSGTAPGPASYAFAIGGLDQQTKNGLPFVMGGVINVDGVAGTGTISGAGSVFDANDNFSGTTYQNHDFLNTSVVSPADAFGRVTFTLNSPVFPELILAGYVVSANKIQLVESADTFAGTLSGTAFTQTVPSGGFTAANSAATYVVGMQGSDTSYFVQSASQLTLASAGTVSGFLDFSDFTATQPKSPDPVTAPAYTVDPTGRVTIAGLTDGTVVDYNLQLYLDGNGDALAITLDDSDAMSGTGYMQSGTTGAYAASDFAGAYTMSTTGWDLNEKGEFDAVGPIAADGSSSYFGFSDVNWLLNYTTLPPLQVSNDAVLGTFTANPNGIFSGTVIGLDLTTCTAFTSTAPGCTHDAFNYYLIDATGDNIAIETDGLQLTIGDISQQ